MLTHGWIVSAVPAPRWGRPHDPPIPDPPRGGDCWLGHVAGGEAVVNAINKEIEMSDVVVQGRDAEIHPPTSVAVIQEGPGALLSAIVSLAKDPAMDIDKFDRLIAMQERMEDRQAERAYNAAFVKLQGRLPAVKRNGALEYPVDKNRPDGPKRLIAKFARWEDIDRVIRPILTEAGFGLSFKIAQRTTEGGGLNISAVLRHEGGHTEVGDPMPVSLDTSGGKNNTQAYGSALSYGKRYAAFAALNLATEGDDDDGKGADKRFISPEQAAELRNLMKQASRDEGAFLERLFNGTVPVVDEIETGAFVIVKNTLDGIIAQRLKKEQG